MQARRKTRLYIVLAVLAGLGLTVSLTLYALSSNIDLFYTPGEIIYGKTETRALPHTGQRLRVGGYVQPGSLQRDPQTLDVRFKLYDARGVVDVSYKGILPDLFREGQGVVAQGVLDGERHILKKEDLHFGYRYSLLSERSGVVLSARLQLQPGDPAQIRAEMDDLMARRKKSQPLEYPNAGSTFKRPEGAFAAQLIDECGLKGARIGGAQVSEKHAGFLVNRGGTAEDFLALMAHVQRVVYRQKGIKLEPEIKILGEDAPVEQV